jgi:8-oxo-dGTP pyrophosphatase MutT (NUDIX family)
MKEVRQAARAVLLDPDDRVLLVRYVNPDTGATFWTTPGGGLGEGETLEACLRRELREEAGLAEFEAGPVVWTRREVFPWAGRILDQHEHFFVVHVSSFVPRPSVVLADEDVFELRWWTLEQLEGSDEAFYPSRLAALVRDLVESGPPPQPIDAGL